MKIDNIQHGQVMKINKIICVFTLAILVCSCTPKISPNPDQIRISDIQGCAHRSPYVNETVTGVEGVVTHKFTTGFTMQTTIPDDQACSSEAIFVFTANYPSVFPGQLVSIDGKIEEFTAGGEDYHNLSRTEMHDPVIKILPGRMGMPNYVSIHNGNTTTPDRYIDKGSEFTVSTDGLDYYESLEFMLVGIDSGIVVGPKNSYNEFVVLPDTKTNANLISENGNLLLQEGDENPETIMVDVASSFTQKVNVGDKFSIPIIGIMEYSFGNYKIWTIQDPVIKSSKPEKEFIQRESDESLNIISYNIENFSMYDDEKKIKGISYQIANELDSPDIVVLHEVMDDSGTVDDGVVTAQDTLENLTLEIKKCGGPEYTTSDNPPENNQDGGIEGGNIRSAVLYRADRGLILDRPDTSVRGLTVRNGEVIIGQNPYRFAQNESPFWGTRKPTIWLFSWKTEKIMIVGVHLVSQAAASPNWGAIQPPEKPEQVKRETQAKLIAESIEKFSRLSTDLGIIVAGDLNDYPWSNTVSTMTANNLNIPLSVELVSESYSYIFEGNSFQLDYILVDSKLAERVLSTKVVHLNASYDQNTRFSDHDPVYLEFANK